MALYHSSIYLCKIAVVHCQSPRITIPGQPLALHHFNTPRLSPPAAAAYITSLQRLPLALQYFIFQHLQMPPCNSSRASPAMPSTAIGSPAQHLHMFLSSSKSRASPAMPRTAIVFASAWPLQMPLSSSFPARTAIPETVMSLQHFGLASQTARYS